MDYLMMKSYSLNRLLVLFATLGFLFLMIDSTIEHWGILKQELMAFIPILFSALGLVMGGITVLNWKEQWIHRFHIFLLAAIVVAGAGLYFHIWEDEDEEQMTDEQREHEKKEKEKPLLAPLSFAGLAAVGLLGTARKWHAEVI